MQAVQGGGDASPENLVQGSLRHPRPPVSDDAASPQKRFTSFTVDVARSVITGGNEGNVRTSSAEKSHRSHHGESQEVLVKRLQGTWRSAIDY